MAKASKVSPSLNPNISHDDDVDDNEDEDNDEESDNIAPLQIKGEMIFKAPHKNKIARSNFMEIMSIAIKGKNYIEELESHLKDHEATIETMEGHGRDYADEIVELSHALENEQTTKQSLEETFALELSRLKESHDRSLKGSQDAPSFRNKFSYVYVPVVKVGGLRPEGSAHPDLNARDPSEESRRRRKQPADESHLPLIGSGPPRAPRRPSSALLLRLVSGKPTPCRVLAPAVAVGVPT
ncbi:hypothetical protein D1007_38318 [Hordeum vulgare]|nr:hypothetical protein D1007_38318 [Hordeum vulgare]